jgi:branched-chain amino acid transport system substrate-binding protein
MFGGLHTEAGLILRQMRGAGVNAVLMGGDGLASSEFAAIAGDAGQGTLMSYGPDPTKRPGAADVVKRFAAKKINPEAYTLYSYASVQVLKQAANDLTRANIMKQAASLDMNLPMLLPGVNVKTGPDDFYPIDRGQLAGCDGKTWVLQGKVFGR